MGSDPNLESRVAALETQVVELAEFLRSALSYISSDPQSSLTKSRIVLERILIGLYRHLLQRDPPRPMIGDVLSDRAFASFLPRRIFVRMNSVRELSNLGPHGEDVEPEDALRVMRDLADIVEWYVREYGPSVLLTSRRTGGQAAEILPQLMAKYPRFIRPDVTSVKFGQLADRCYLEIAVRKPYPDGKLYDEGITRTDLGFVIDSIDATDPLENDNLFFNPKRTLAENVDKFLKEFDEVSILNCTDLFTPEAGEEVAREIRGEQEQKPN